MLGFDETAGLGMYAVKFTIKLDHPDLIWYSGYLSAIEIIRGSGACDAHRERLDVELTGDDLFVLGTEFQLLCDELDAMAPGVWGFPERDSITILHAGSEVAAR